MSFNNLKASKPKISLIFGLSFLALGGVLGKEKLKSPRATETSAAK